MGDFTDYLQVLIFSFASWHVAPIGSPRFCTRKLPTGETANIEIDTMIIDYENGQKGCPQWCLCQRDSTFRCQSLGCIPGHNQPCIFPPPKEPSSFRRTLAHGEVTHLPKKGPCTCFAGEFVCLYETIKTEDAKGQGIWIFIAYSLKEADWIRSKILHNSDLIKKSKFDSSLSTSFTDKLHSNSINEVFLEALKALKPQPNCRLKVNISRAQNTLLHAQVFNASGNAQWQNGGSEEGCLVPVDRVYRSFLHRKSLHYQILASTIKQIAFLDTMDDRPSGAPNCAHYSFSVVLTIFVIKLSF